MSGRTFRRFAVVLEFVAIAAAVGDFGDDELIPYDQGHDDPPPLSEGAQNATSTASLLEEHEHEEEGETARGNPAIEARAAKAAIAAKAAAAAKAARAGVTTILNAHYPCAKWAPLIEDPSKCPFNATADANITCKLQLLNLVRPQYMLPEKDKIVYKVYRFGPGIFGIDRQILVPERTILQGNDDPAINTWDVAGSVGRLYARPAEKLSFVNDRNVRPFLSEDFDPHTGTQTLILAEKPVTTSYICMTEAQIASTRIGVDTGVRQSYPDGVICTGAIFETKGCSIQPCVSFNVADVLFNGAPAGDGEAVSNVLIENIRVNDVSHAENVFISNVHVQNFGGSNGGIAIGGIGGSSNVVVRDTEVVITMPGNAAAGCGNVYGAAGKIVFQNFRCVTRHRTMLTLGAAAEAAGPFTLFVVGNYEVLDLSEKPRTSAGVGLLTSASDDGVANAPFTRSGVTGGVKVLFGRKWIDQPTLYGGEKLKNSWYGQVASPVGYWGPEEAINGPGVIPKAGGAPAEDSVAPVPAGLPDLIPVLQNETVTGNSTVQTYLKDSMGEPMGSGTEEDSTCCGGADDYLEAALHQPEQEKLNITKDYKDVFTKDERLWLKIPEFEIPKGGGLVGGKAAAPPPLPGVDGKKVVSAGELTKAWLATKGGAGGQKDEPTSDIKVGCCEAAEAEQIKDLILEDKAEEKAAAQTLPPQVGGDEDWRGPDGHVYRPESSKDRREKEAEEKEKDEAEEEKLER
eukprot:g18553.t1